MTQSTVAINVSAEPRKSFFNASDLASITKLSSHTGCFDFPMDDSLYARVINSLQSINGLSNTKICR